MAVYTEDAAENQAAHPPDNSGEVHLRRKVGVEIVVSAPMPRNLYRGWRPGRALISRREAVSKAA